MKTPARRYHLAFLFSLLALFGVAGNANRNQETSYIEKPSYHYRSSNRPATLRIDKSGAAKISSGKKSNEAAAIDSLSNESAVTGKDAEGEVFIEPTQIGGSYNITRSVVSGGGSASTGGSNSIAGSIGQSAIATSTGGSYSLSGGFWGDGTGTGGSCPTITISPVNTTLPPGQAGQPYNQSFTQTGGVGTITWSISAGSPPANVTLNPSTGVLSGAPTGFGTFNFSVRATDSANGGNCSGERAYSLLINSPCPIITVNPPSLPNGDAGLPYNQTITAIGGAAPYGFMVSGGALPPGLLLSTTGALSGTPTSGGSFSFTITATDANNCTGSRGYSVTIIGPPPTVLQYYPLPRPIRLFDTRASIPGFPACEFLNQPLIANAELAKQARITCDAITIPVDAQAIVGNATVVSPAGNGFITLWPNGQARPPVSNLNYTTGQVVANAFTVGLGPDGVFKIYSPASTHFIVDITGYYAPPGTGGLYYHPLPKPIRLFDTRATIPGFPACEYLNQPLVADAELAKQARITCDSITIPADAQAIVGNATVVNPTGNGFIILWPNGQIRPPVSNLNYSTGQVVPNAFTVGLGSDGQFRVYSSAGTHFVADVTGYYSPSATDVNGGGLFYTPLSKPIRLFDTRATIPGFPACEYLNQPLLANQEIAKQARITCDSVTIPTDALAVVGNATVTGPTGNGFITLYPDGQARPPVSNLNYVTGQTVPNAFTVGLGSNGQFRVYSSAGTHFIVDLTGYFSP